MSDEAGAARRRRRLAWRGTALGITTAALLAAAQARGAAPPPAGMSPGLPSVPSPASASGDTTATTSSAAGTTPGAPSAPATPAGPAAAEDPAPTAAPAAVAVALAAGGIPVTARDAYVHAAATAPARCSIGWPIIAAIGRVESDHGRFAGAELHTDGLSTPPIVGIALNGVGTALIPDTDGGRLDGDPVFDHAVGPMQFIPSTWAAYATDGDGDGRRDPFDINDAAAAAARYLCAAGGNLSSVAGQRRAVYAYNQSDSYVATVLTLAARYAGTPPPTLPTEAPRPAPVPPANPAPPPAVHAPVRPPAAPASSPAAGSRTATASPPVTSSSRTTRSSSSSRPATTPPATSPSTSPSTSPPPETTAPSPPTSTAPPPPTSTAPPPPTSTAPPETTAPPDTTAPSKPPTATPSTSPAAPACEVPALKELGTVDIRNGSGDPAVATAVAARLQRAGITVGEVITGRAATSAVDYPAGRSGPAARLARALDVAAARPAPVDRITVVIGVRDAGGLDCTG